MDSKWLIALAIVLILAISGCSQQPPQNNVPAPEQPTAPSNEPPVSQPPTPEPAAPEQQEYAGEQYTATEYPSDVTDNPLLGGEEPETASTAAKKSGKGIVLNLLGPPASPTGLAVTLGSPNTTTANLSWDPVPGIAIYVVYTSNSRTGSFTPVASNLGAIVASSPNSRLTTTHSNLSSGEHCYKVSAIDEAENESALSEAVCTTINAGPQPPLPSPGPDCTVPGNIDGYTNAEGEAVDAVDVQLAENLIAGTITVTSLGVNCNADISDNGKINRCDLELVRKAATNNDLTDLGLKRRLMNEITECYADSAPAFSFYTKPVENAILRNPETFDVNVYVAAMKDPTGAYAIINDFSIDKIVLNVNGNKVAEKTGTEYLFLIPYKFYNVDYYVAVYNFTVDATLLNEGSNIINPVPFISMKDETPTGRNSRIRQYIPGLERRIFLASDEGPSNLVRNGSFTTGNAFGWGIFEGSEVKGANGVVDESGNNYFKVVNDGTGDYFAVMQQINTKPGATYEYGGNIKAELNAGTCQIDLYNPGGGVQNYETPVDTSDIVQGQTQDWKKFSGTLTVNNTYLKIRLIAHNLNGICSFDNIYMIKTADGPEQPKPVCGDGVCEGIEALGSCQLDCSKPAAPTGVTASAISSTANNVTWNAVSGAASYKIYLYNAGTHVGDSATPSFVHENLLSDATYCYKVKSVNSKGESDYSGPTGNHCAKTLPEGISAAPTNVTATASTNMTVDGEIVRTISISWSASSGATSYKIYKSTTGPTGTYSYFATNTASPSYDSTYPGLIPDTQYCYQVSAIGTLGSESAKSIAACATTSPTPPAPTGLQATVVSQSQVNLSWNAVSGAAGYHLYRSTTGILGEYTSNEGLLSSNSFSDSGLAASTQYCYKIDYISYDNSAVSDSVCATTLAG